MFAEVKYFKITFYEPNQQTDRGGDCMTSYLMKLAAQYEGALEALCVVKPEDKVAGRLIPGAKCAWCFEDDIEYWKSERLPYPHPKDWPYHGYIMPFPETNGRSEMEAEHVCVVIVDYPIEKENPVTDWTTLAQILSSPKPKLHRFYVFEPVRIEQAK